MTSFTLVCLLTLLVLIPAAGVAYFIRWCWIKLTTDKPKKMKIGPDGWPLHRRNP